MSTEKKMLSSIAVYRFLAALIVLYYHLVQIPTYSHEVFNVYSLTNTILPDSLFAKIGLEFYYRLHVDTGSLAVTMFFIASGYLISMMMDRYSRREFLVNRALSTFPTLWVSLVVIAVFVFCANGITFTPRDYLTSGTLIWPHLHGSLFSAAFWTLRIELKFYILAALFWRKRKELVIYGYMLAILAAAAFYEFRAQQMYSEMLDLQFMYFLYLGIVIERAQHGLKNGWKYVAACMLCNILTFKISVWLFNDASSRMSYPACVTQVLPVVLLVLLIRAEQKWPMEMSKRVPRFVMLSSKIMLPLYLTHVSCGLSIMLLLSRAGCGFLVTLLGGVGGAVAVAIGVYFLATKPSTALMKRTIAGMRKEK